MDKLTQILEAISKAFKIPVADLTAMVNKDANSVTDFESKVVSVLETQFNDGKKTGETEGKKGLKGEFGKFAKEKLGYEKNIDKFDDNFKAELTEHFKTTLKADLDAELKELEKNKGGNAEEIKLKKQEIENLKTQITTDKANYEEKEKNLESSYNKKFRFATSENRLQAFLTEFGANVPTDSILANKKFEILKSQLQELADLEVDETDKKTYILEADGQRKRANGLPITFEEWGKDKIDVLYGLKKTEPKGGGATPPKPEGGDGGTGTFKAFKGTAPKTVEEYNAIIGDNQKYTATERLEVMNHWEVSNPPPTE